MFQHRSLQRIFFESLFHLRIQHSSTIIVATILTYINHWWKCSLQSTRQEARSWTILYRCSCDSVPIGQSMAIKFPSMAPITCGIFHRASNSLLMRFRSSTFERVPLLWTTCGQKYFSFRGAKLWNGLDEKSKLTNNFKLFKSSLKNSRT